MKNRNIGILALVIVLLAAVTIFFIVTTNHQPDQETDSVPEAPGQLVASASAPPEQADSSVPVSSQSPTPEVLSDPDADATLAALGTIGEAYTLHARQYQQGEAREEETASLGWDGDMTLVVQSATLLPYEEDANGEDAAHSVWGMYADGFSDPCVLHLELHLENVDAHNRTGVQYQFNASMFYLSAYEDLIPQNRQDPTYTTVTQRFTAMESYFDKNTGTKDYWSFQLRPGETMDFVLEFLIDRAYLEQQSPFLAVSQNWDIKAGVLLDSIGEEAMS